MRDINQFGEQGREQAMDAIRNLDVASYGWTKEASHAYGLEPDFRQVGLVAQQASSCIAKIALKHSASHPLFAPP